MNTTPDNYKPNSCKPVYKFNLKGDLVHVYSRMTDAIKSEHIASNKLKDLLNSSIAFKGHTFSLSSKIKGQYNASPFTIDNNNEQMPWESDNGTFDINGWAKICF